MIQFIRKIKIRRIKFTKHGSEKKMANILLSSSDSSTFVISGILIVSGAPLGGSSRFISGPVKLVPSSEPAKKSGNLLSKFEAP